MLQKKEQDISAKSLQEIQKVRIQILEFYDDSFII